MTESLDSKKATPEVSVADKVLLRFVESVLEDKDLADIGARLRKTIVEERDGSEGALRQALFGDDAL